MTHNQVSFNQANKETQVDWERDAKEKKSPMRKHVSFKSFADLNLTMCMPSDF